MLNNLTRTVKLGCLKYLLWFKCRQLHCISVFWEVLGIGILACAFERTKLCFLACFEQFSLAVGNNVLSRVKGRISSAEVVVLPCPSGVVFSLPLRQFLCLSLLLPTPHGMKHADRQMEQCD